MNGRRLLDRSDHGSIRSEPQLRRCRGYREQAAEGLLGKERKNPRDQAIEEQLLTINKAPKKLTIDRNMLFVGLTKAFIVIFEDEGSPG